MEIQPRASLFASRVTPAPRRTPQTGPALNVKVSARRAGLRSHSQFVIGAEEVTNPGPISSKCCKSGFSQTDFTEDLKKITVPVLVMHGDDDQIVPYADSAPLSAKLLKNGTLKTYKGFPHAMPTTEADTINNDLLSFFKAAAQAAA